MASPFAQRTPAVLALADGTVFYGYSIGATGATAGNVIFNTAMCGYQEALTDPNNAGQMLALTYPHIGNTGVNPEDVESRSVAAAGLIVKDVLPVMSNFRATQSLPDYLKDNNVVAIAGVDTRKLTRILRNGTQRGAIVVGNDKNKALALAQAQVKPVDWVSKVSVIQPYHWEQGAWHLGSGYSKAAAGRYRVVVYDFGVKRSVLRMLVDKQCEVIVVNAKTSVEEVLKYLPDGVFLSNGPGDANLCDYAIASVKQLLEKNIPIMGIDLGCQILALACGAKTKKLRYGHHGVNHPVLDYASGNVWITSQNNDYVVDIDSLNETCKVTHRSLFDDSLMGFTRVDKAAFGFQGFPETLPSRFGIGSLFDQFINNMKETSNK